MNMTSEINIDEMESAYAKLWLKIPEKGVCRHNRKGQSNYHLDRLREATNLIYDFFGGCLEDYDKFKNLFGIDVESNKSENELVEKYKEIILVAAIEQGIKKVN